MQFHTTCISFRRRTFIWQIHLSSMLKPTCSGMEWKICKGNYLSVTWKERSGWYLIHVNHHESPLPVRVRGMADAHQFHLHLLADLNNKKGLLLMHITHFSFRPIILRVPKLNVCQRRNEDIYHVIKELEQSHLNLYPGCGMNKEKGNVPLWSVPFNAVAWASWATKQIKVRS